MRKRSAVSSIIFAMRWGLKEAAYASPIPETPLSVVSFTKMK